jgi:hypothetical protein
MSKHFLRCLELMSSVYGKLEIYYFALIEDVVAGGQ